MAKLSGEGKHVLALLRGALTLDLEEGHHEGISQAKLRNYATIQSRAPALWKGEGGGGVRIYFVSI